MGVVGVEVLLVGPRARGFSQLLQWLGHRDCECHFATTCKEACALVSRSGYDLVLSEYDLPDRAAYPLLEKLIGSTSTLFLSTIVENGFLWVPALLRGRRWPDAHMLRPGELSEVLSDVLKKVRYEKAEREKMVHAATLGDALELVVVAPAPGDARNRTGFCAASSQPRSRVATVLAELLQMFRWKYKRTIVTKTAWFQDANQNEEGDSSGG